MTDDEKDAWARFTINLAVRGPDRGDEVPAIAGGFVKEACMWAHWRRLTLDRPGGRLVARMVKGETMTTVFIPLSKIHSNPFQTRPIDQKYVDDVLAPDIAEHGLLQPPMGRGNHNDGQVELAFGHHRLAAFQTLHALHPEERRWQEMPIEIADLDDRQMFERAIVENEKRKPTSPIEKAQTLKKYIATFKVTQGEAGKLFDLDQPSVSNLLSLLDYPEAVQARVHDGSLPLRYAWMLKSVARFFPDRAVNAAGVIAKADDNSRERIADEVVEKVWRTAGVAADRMAWAPDWKPDPAISAEMTKPDMGEPKDPPACKGCPAYVKFGDDHYCGRPPCFHLKERLWALKEMERISKKTGIPIAAPGQLVKPVFDFKRTDWDDMQQARALVEKKPKGLVLIPGDPGEAGWDQERAVGSAFVTIAAEDPKALLKSVAGSSNGAGAKAEKPVDETEAQRAKRLAKRRAELERNVHAMEQWHRDRADSHWLIEHTASALGPHLAISGPILAECETELTERDYVEFATGFTEDEDNLEKHIAVAEKRGEDTDDLRRAHILYNTFVKVVFSDPYGGGVMLEYQQKHLVFGKVAERILKRVVDLELNAHLPKDWSKVPIHRTPLNCWECGRFGRDPEHITFTELKQGWQIVGKPEAPTAVYCPDHKAKAAAQSGKANGKLDGKHAKPSKAAVRVARDTTPKGSGARGMIKARR